jgi:hypothetical protein
MTGVDRCGDAVAVTEHGYKVFVMPSEVATGLTIAL